MTNKLVEYSRNISPLIRDSIALKEQLKEFKEANQKAIDLADAIKESQSALKEYIEDNDDSAAILAAIKELDIEIKEAVKAAAKDTEYKPADLKKYFTARCKEEGVDKVVAQGEMFAELEEIINA